ncbi:aminotransferase class I/II-fold pyridoxal phosphate-dependent enzyme [Streptomyces sp. XM4193]|uniref:aminotransferase class I/II-fold pyridoxal phosphate-dependent enzyme n=1 Tax=Streptomyces sp. XM4193 TaxID=2929782 RepID=UPI001FFBBD75|nr:aminotransferase class I/II-fold pyridoxal phosphate-dependent enzyme [Streptomyces sp. XM4193]MCK1799010.1 aminotransferase class I/II-fold pyridoxal phosphate-dependent enzyme [Streptomyces sp. XM4193]
MIEGTNAAEIALSVEGELGSGELAPGQLLPPIRQLAAQLGVNPNTVAAAYRTLRERGVIETAGRRGSRIRERPATTPRETLGVQVPQGVADVSQGNPDPALLPSLRAALAAAAPRYGAGAPLYGGPSLAEEFETLAREQLLRDGVPPGPLAATSGASDAIERVLAAHLRPGDAVALEDPGWGSLLDLVPSLGLRPVPVALDDDGPLPASVAGALERGARALLVTTRAQNPTGAALSADRAKELRPLLAARPETLLIEDDHGHGIVAAPPQLLAGATRHWALVRSTAKAYGPDLRLAVLTGDEVTLDRVRGRQRLGPGWVSHLLQTTVSELWRAGAVDPAAVGAAYDRSRGRLLDRLARQGVRAQGRSGMNVWVPVPEESAVVSRLLLAGWAVAPGARFRLSSPPAVRLTVSGLADARIDALADAVAEAVRPGPARRYG